MAIAFELVVNFGDNEAAAQAAYEIAAAGQPLTIGGLHIGLHKPLLHHERGYDEVPFFTLSILPIGVGQGVAMDRGHPLVELSPAELTELSDQLYRLLSTFTGYRAASVGWDPEGRADPAELQQEWADELKGGSVPGVVLAEDVLPELRGPAFEPFAPGYVWIPDVPY